MWISASHRPSGARAHDTVTRSFTCAAADSYLICIASALIWMALVQRGGRESDTSRLRIARWIQSLYFGRKYDLPLFNSFRVNFILPVAMATAQLA